MGEGGPGGKENSGKTNALTHVKGQLESLSDNLEYCIFFLFLISGLILVSNKFSNCIACSSLCFNLF